MLAQPDPPSWRALKRVWPHAETSRFVEADGLRWHVQMMGSGPALLLLHGAGASTHSWRDVMPLLAERYTVVAADLPGHGFTETPPVYRPTLPRVARLVAGLMRALDMQVDVAVGHSAGAAIIGQMLLERVIEPRAFVSINGAFNPFEGVAGQLFPAIAKLLFVNPFMPRLFAMQGRDQRRVQRLIEGTGSSLDARGLDIYHALMMSPGHISGVLAMMANWDLEGFEQRLGDVETPTLLLAADGDLAVPPQVSQRVAAHMPHATFERLTGLGHLAHEEAPDLIAERIIAFAEAEMVAA
ncbi:MAG: alpha/beta fold hydrolase [Devosiaceae bacterium]|nr:alpha/beta fold hydrolase [Devosiaceae bacterium MH13]